MVILWLIHAYSKGRHISALKQTVYRSGDHGDMSIVIRHAEWASNLSALSVE